MRRFISYAGAAVIISLLFATTYATVQQAQRSDANYPQIQIAEDVATGLNRGSAPATLLTGKIDLASSLDPFTIIYDKSGHAVASSGYLDGMVPVVPRGVLASADGKPYSFVTWQPQSGVRVAAVSVAADNYYVLSGRSLTEVERNISKTFRLTALGWLASLLALGVMYVAQKAACNKR